MHLNYPFLALTISVFNKWYYIEIVSLLCLLIYSILQNFQLHCCVSHTNSLYWMLVLDAEIILK